MTVETRNLTTGFVFTSMGKEVLIKDGNGTGRDQHFADCHDIEAAVLITQLLNAHCRSVPIDRTLLTADGLNSLLTETAMAATRSVVGVRAVFQAVTDSLEAEIEARYDKLKDHPAMKPKYDRDMADVLAAKQLLGTEGEKA
jgi:hypothetical protein